MRLDYVQPHIMHKEKGKIMVNIDMVKIKDKHNLAKRLSFEIKDV